MKKLIKCNSFSEFAKENSHLPIIHGNLEKLDSLFKIANDNPKKNFVLITSDSDYGLARQRLEHPNADLYKSFLALNWSEIMSRRDAYCSIEISPRIENDKCSPAHDFSVKCDRFTALTFNKEDIPKNIKKWFSTNINIPLGDIPILSFLPFGVNFDGNGHEILAEKMLSLKPVQERYIDVYLNYTIFSQERLMVKQQIDYISKLKSGINIVIKEPNISVSEFYDDIANSKLVVSPFGNGYDSFRTYESAYLGAIPLITDSFFFNYVSKVVPSINLSDFFQSSNFEALTNIIYNPYKLDLNYWFDLIKKECEKI